MTKKLYSQAALAKLAGVSRAAVTKLKKKLPVDAFEGDKIDAAHPVVSKWLKGSSQRKTVKPKEPIKQTVGNDLPKTEPPPKPMIDEPLPYVPGESDDIKIYEDMTINQVLHIHGTSERFLDYLKARKVLPEIALKDLQAKEKSGEYISRDIVSKFIMPLIDNAMKKTIEDMPQTLAAKALRLVKSGSDLESIVNIFRTDLGSNFKGLKKQTMDIIADA